MTHFPVSTSTPALGLAFLFLAIGEMSMKGAGNPSPVWEKGGDEGLP